MNKLSFCFRTLLCLLLIAACSSQKTDQEQGHELTESSRPNVVFIMVDDLRPELNTYGARQIKSPNIDKLAAQSTVFNRAYCNIPTCGASRASLLSGVRPTRNRFIIAATHKDKDYPEGISIPKLFKENGYTTISNGKIYHVSEDDTLAWNEIWQASNTNNFALPENIALAEGDSRGVPYEKADIADDVYKDGKIANKAIENLRKLKDSNSPFFLAVGFRKPHLPFSAPAKYWEMYKREDITLPANYFRAETTPSTAFHTSGELRAYHSVPQHPQPITDEMAKELIHGYYASVSYVDAQVGKVMEELVALGMDKNTIVVLLGDHGWNLGDHLQWNKHCTFESSLHSPLMVKVPGITNGQKTNAITEFIDIYPSLCELVGIDPPAHIEGESFVPLLKGGTREKNYAVSKFKDAVTLIKWPYFYTEWTNKEGKAYARMLFNHETDPLEMDNLAEKAIYKDTVAQLAIELRQKWGKDFFKEKNETMVQNH